MWHLYRHSCEILTISLLFVYFGNYVYFPHGYSPFDCTPALWASRGPCSRRDWMVVSPKSSACVCVFVCVCVPPIRLLIQRAMCWAVMWCVNMFRYGVPTVPGYVRGRCICLKEQGGWVWGEGVTWGLFGLDPRQRRPVYGARVHPSLWCPV